MYKKFERNLIGLRKKIDLIIVYNIRINFQKSIPIKKSQLKHTIKRENVFKKHIAE